ncbi:hypothetical protein NY547_19190 [Cnuibacter physcomitrellae]|uniref:hypothetical protein n=1 Tax=Cnuibacter physcomitrellae TaxID=1619308 RepID=UPI002176066C|nr:hypothetical protein [Cnuibacter physcomitrellae]MCS5499372.1 hypothetical protein [Cnuibacter physcomitrellae]
MQWWIVDQGIAFWVLGTLAIIGVFLLVRRRRRFERFEVDDARAAELSTDLLSDLRASSAGPDRPVSTPSVYWRSLGAPLDTMLKVLESLQRSGRIVLPSGYTIRGTGLLWRHWPEHLALTPSSFEALSPKPAPIAVYGPAHFGSGDQTNSGSFTYSVNTIRADLDRLALQVAADARRNSGRVADDLNTAADDLARAAEEEEPNSERTRSRIRWLLQLASDTSAAVISAGVIAGATALLAALSSP